MRVEGRNLRRPVTRLVATGSGVTVRIDDDADPMFWLNIHLTRADLDRLVGMLDAAGADPVPAYELGGEGG